MHAPVGVDRRACERLRDRGSGPYSRVTMQRPEPAPSAGIVGPRRAAPRRIVAACAVVAALLLAEAIARIEGPAVCVGRRSVLLAGDEEVGWTFTPRLTITADPCAEPGTRHAWSAPVAINADGLHDQPWPHAKPRGEVRVLLLGDEVADGVGIARADRLSVRLAHLTDRTRGARVAAINGLIPGYGPAESLRFLERRGVKYEPDVVVLLVDPERDLAATLDPPEVQAVAADIPPASGLLALSASARWLAGRPAEVPARPVRIDEPEPIGGDAARARARTELIALVRRMAEVSRAAGAKLAIAIAPRCPLAPASDQPSLCGALEGVAPCVDLAPVFADLAATKSGPSELCLSGQPRWGRDGHFLASHKIWDTLAASQLWPATVVRGHRL